MAKSFLIIGLGRFGSSIAIKLCELGHEVMALDINPAHVERIAEQVTRAAEADATDERVLQRIGVDQFDSIVIATGDNIQSSLLATVICRELGAKHIIAKASDDIHEKLLLKTGADRVVRPEREAGIRLAHTLVSGSVLDFISLSNEYSINETMIPLEWVGRSLAELAVRTRYSISVIAIRRDGGIIVAPGPNAPLQSGDTLTMVGSNRDLEAIAAMES